jgi:homoserine dehydrogenase
VKEVKIGIIGFGTVGAGVAAYLLENKTVITKRTGMQLTLIGISDIDIKTDRKVNVPKELLTTDTEGLIEKADLIVELIGGITAAKDYILKTLKHGKPVITANKALLAEYGEELFAVAENSKTNIYYEASVAGGIPIIKSLREGLAGNRIEKICGILNGTCNYILTKMEQDKANFNAVLKRAGELGYAEADPSLDIDGDDTAHKAVILASLAYGEWFGMESVYIEGIRNMSLIDIKFAEELGYRVKLLGIIKKDKDDVQIRVHPALIPSQRLMANIGDVNNGVFVKGVPVGDVLFYGRGAGMEATSSAVIADIIDVALNLKFNSHGRIPAFRMGKQFKNLIEMKDITTRYYLRVQVKDQLGVFAQISTILGEEKISISSLLQKEKHSIESLPIVIVTHETQERNIIRAVNRIEALDVVVGKVNIIRIEDF